MAHWSPNPPVSADTAPRPSATTSDAPAAELAYVALVAHGDHGRRDGIGVVDTTPGSATLGKMVGRVDFPHGDNEVRHFGWIACPSQSVPAAHGKAEHRYLVAPGVHSSRIHIIDTKPDPRAPQLLRVIDGEDVMRRTGYAAPHTVHCGPDGIYVSALGASDGAGPGGIFTLDPETFEVQGRWEKEGGPQHLAYDFHWHARHAPAWRESGAAALWPVRPRAARVGPAYAPA